LLKDLRDFFNSLLQRPLAKPSGLWYSIEGAPENSLQRRLWTAHCRLFLGLCWERSSERVMPDTLEEVARLTCVSRPTVSPVINDYFNISSSRSSTSTISGRKGCSRFEQMGSEISQTLTMRWLLRYQECTRDNERVSDLGFGGRRIGRHRCLRYPANSGGAWKPSGGYCERHF